MAKKITLKDKEGTVLCPHTAIEQVEGLKEALESGGNIEIDTRNLIPNSSKIGGLANGNYYYTRIKLPAGAKKDDIFTFNCDKIEKVQGNATSYTLFFQDIANNITISWSGASITEDNRVIQLKLLNDVEQGNLALYLYSGSAGATAGNEVYFYNCTLVKGDKPMLLWQAAPEDIQEQIDGKLSLTGGTLTGEIIAPSFKTTLTSGKSEAVMAYPINKSWSNDLNSESYLKAGMYQTSSKASTANQPSETGYGNVVTVMGDSTLTTNAGQIYLDSWRTSSKAYIRAGQTSSEAEKDCRILDKPWREIRFRDDSITTSDIGEAVITPAKIQTSIALNGTPSMTVEPTMSSPDKTIASVGLVKEVVDGIEIGGRNLFIATDVVLGGIDGSTGAENTGSVRAKSGGYIPVTGDILTAKSWDNSLKFMICYYNQSKAFLTSSWKENNNTWIETSVKKYAVPANTAYIRVLLAKNNNAAFTSSELSSIKIKIEQGNKATDWSPAPEDIEAKIEASKPTIFLQTLQPSATEVKEGDIWIIQ